MKVYKVVSTDDGVLKSYNGSYLESMRLPYAIGHKTVPIIKNSSLFAFTKLVYARNFAKANHNLSDTLLILSCEADISKDQRHEISVFTKDVEEFWMSDNPDVCTEPPPEGTIFCDSITPIKEIK